MDQRREVCKRKVPAVGYEIGGEFEAPPALDARRAQQILGIKFRSMEDTISSFLDHQLELKAQL
jgi:hypothetical protein